MGNEYRYDAFISYRHISPDKEIAEKLQKKLESYKPPKALRNLKKRGGLRIFRDETELRTSSDLSNDIKVALKESRFLIVVCSKDTKDSRWCLEEIEHFKDLHNGSNANIITLVADGEPEEVFPPSLCNELIPVTDENGEISYQNHTIEPLAANVAGKTLRESFKKLNAELLRIVAPLLGCGYDLLYNRENKKRIKRMLSIGGAIIALLLLFGVYNSAMLWEINSQRLSLAAANEDLRNKTDELNKSNQMLQQSNEELARKTQEAEDNLEEAKHQQALAEANALEANVQRGIAVKNMRMAQENEAAANEANRNLRAKTSEILANQSRIYLENDDVTAAVQTALDSLALSKEAALSNTAAENVLINATGAYSHEERLLCKKVNLSGYVEFLEFSSDGARVLAMDSNDIVYVIDYLTGDIIKTFTPLETFGTVSTAYAISDICVEGNTGFVFGKGQLLSINLTDGSVNWHYKPQSYSPYFSAFATNRDSEKIVLLNAYSPLAISKSTGTEISSFDRTDDLTYNSSLTSNSYLSSDGKLYVADLDAKNIAVYNFDDNSKVQYPLEIPNKCDLLAVGENKDCLFVNLKIGSDYTSPYGATMICFNKGDMSTKWSSSYEAGITLSPYNLNKIFEFTHKIPNKEGEYYTTTGIVAVSGCCVMAFDRKNGEVYFKTETDYENELLYCEPNDSLNLKVATSQTYWPQTALAKADGSLFEKDGLFNVGETYTFDTERKYITCAKDDRFALASANSSEISLYYGHTNSNYTLLSEFPEIGYHSLSQHIDNGHGVFAGYYYTYDDERQDYIVIYDVNNNKLLAHKQLSVPVKQMCFIGTDTLFLVDADGYAAALKTDGKVFAEGNVHTLIRKSAGLSQNDALSTSSLHLSPAENGVLYCIPDGIFKIEISGNGFIVNKILYNRNLSEYFVSNDFISFLKEDWASDICRLLYFTNGDSKVSYAKENGENATFRRGSVSSVINNKNGEIAFISKEGYIGLYRRDDNKISKILLPAEEVSPLKILFTPDFEYIIAMCSNGDFVKYSAKSLQEVGRYKSELVIDPYSQFEFIDETVFMVRSYEGSEDITLVDSTTMELKAEIEDFVCFMPKDGKIIFRMYVYGEGVFGCYNYLSSEELIDFANDFLKGLSVSK